MIKYDLNKRVAVVTGGAQGFGLAVSERFIEAGAKVIIWDIDEEAIKKALKKVNSENLTYQIVDVNDFENINKPKFNDRTQWCNDIAYAQWHPSELESGEAWNHLKGKIKL